MRETTRRAALTGLFSVAACAPMVQRAGMPPIGFRGPRIEASSFVASDGTALPLDVHLPEGEPWAVLVCLHGMNDYAHAFAYSAPWGQAHGVATYAYDQRGFGRAPHRGVWGGTELMTEDLRTLCALVRERHPRAVVGVLGHSMGGAVAIAAFASDRPPVADRLILAAPAVWGWSRQPLPNKLVLWIGAHVTPGTRLVAPGWLVRKIRASDNLEVLIAMSRDPNMIFDTRIDAVYGLMQLMQAADRGVGQVRMPLLYLYGAKDQIIPKAATFHAARGLKPSDRSVYYPDGYHLLTRDLQGRTVWGDIEAHLRDPAAPAPSGFGPIRPA